MNLRVPVQFIPLLAMALTAAALMTPGRDRGVEEPARFVPEFPLREGARRVPAAGSLPVQPHAISQSIVLPQHEPAVLLPGTDAGTPYGAAGRRGVELPDGAASPVQPAPARAVLGRNQKPLLPEFAQVDAMGLRGADEVSGWGWLEDDIRAMDKAAAQRAAEAAKRQDDELFGARSPGGQTPAAGVDSSHNFFGDTRADGTADHGTLFDSGRESGFSIE